MGVPWSAPPPRAATRSHPGTETSDPPPPEQPSTPPPSTRGKGVSVPAWAIGVGAILGALGGAGGLKSIVEAATAPKPATTEQADDIRSDLKRLRADFDEDRAARKAERLAESRRWDIAQGALCRFNGPKPAPFARRVECDAVIWDPPPLGADGPWTAREEFPQVPRP